MLLFRATRASGDPAMKDMPQTVFVVDDDDAVRNSLRMLLKSAGVHAEASASAQEFLSTYEVTQPGCLVLDVRMPGMSGLEMQHELNLRGATIPVSYTHLRAHETPEHLVCRLLLEK